MWSTGGRAFRQCASQALAAGLLGLLGVLAVLLFATPAWAADGDLDTTFSGDGWRKQNRTAKNDEARSLAFRSDGSVVVAGWDDNNHSSAAALRMVTIAFTAAGGGDGPFSSSHSPKTDREFWSPLTDSAEEVLLLSDGRYAFVGYAGTHATNANKDYDCVVMVRGTNAFRDNSFAGNGKKFIEFSAANNEKCYAGALQSDDKILVGGWVYTSGANGWDLALARVNSSDGTLDTSFGSSGKVIYNAGGGGELITAIDVQDDGKILVAGTTNSAGTNDFFVARYTSAGALDTSFSGDGIHIFDMGAVDYLHGMDLQSDGKIVVGGYSGNDWAIARLTTAGAMDTSFGGGDGITVTNFGGTEEASEVIVASDGKILLGGYTNAAGNQDFALARYTSAGVLDTSFGGGDGVTTHDFGGIDKARAMGIAANGNVLLVGSTKSGSDTDWGLVQFVSSTQVGTPGFTVSETSRTVSETGSTQTFTVVLTGQPSSDVVLDVASSDTGEATVSASSLTFTSGNWDTAQTVTVTGVADYADDGDQTSTVTVSVDDGSSDDDYDSLADQTVSVTTTDIDAAPDMTVTQTGGSTSVNEALSGNTDTFTVVLTMQPSPSNNVVVNVTSADTGEATVSISSLTFTSSNWDTPQTVTVTGVDEDLDDGDQTVTVTMTVDDASSYDPYDSVSNETVSVTVVDDDTAGFTLSGTTASVSETGSTATFTVVLDSEPTGDVVFGISSADTGEATVSAAALTFTSSDWDTPQTVTVTGIDDTATDGNQTTDVTVTVNDSSTADSAYDALADQTVVVTTADDDSPGFTVAASGGSTTVSEAGSTDTFTVVLNAQPTSDVVFNVSSGDTGEATVSTSSLTFTSSNWNTTQTVTVTGIDDTANDGDQTTTITVSVNDGSSDDAYDSLSDETLSATTTDDDSPGITLSKTSTSVSETGTSDTFTVVLNVAPSSNVVVNVTASDSGEASVSPSALTFTSSNWNTAQTVTVTGIDDPDDDGSQASTVTLSVDDATSDDDYDVVSDSSVSVLTDDDDVPLAPTTTSPAPTTSILSLGTVSISAIPSCSAVTLHWGVGTTSGLQSFSLASKAPGGGWITHSTHLPAARSFAIGSLANGPHSFQILAVYDDGSSKASNVGDVNISDCPVILLPPPATTTTAPPTTTTTAPPTTTTTPATTTTTTPATTTTTTPATTTTTTAPPTTTTTPATTTTVIPTTTVAPTTVPPATTTAAPPVTTTTAAPSTTTTTPATTTINSTPTTTTTSSSGGAAVTTTQPPSTTTSTPVGQDDGEIGSVSAALSSAKDSGQGDGGLDLVNPTSAVISAGLLAALGAGLGWWKPLGRFLAGTALAAFLLGFWRRRKVPGPPRDVSVTSDAAVDRFTWVRPARGKDPDRYSIEGLVGQSWILVHDHLSTVTHAEHPVSNFPAVTRWRITASNEYGTGKPSVEVDVASVLQSTSNGGGPPSGHGNQGGEGD